MKKKPAKSAQHGGAIQQAVTLSGQGNDKQARAVIEKHLSKFPRDLEALNLAATLAARQENWADAERHFMAALSVDPANGYALYNISKVFKLSNRPGAALEALTRLLKAEPKNVAALNEIGTLLVAEGHLDPALQALEAATEIDPTFEMAHRNLYTTLYTAGRYDEAVYVAKKAIEHISSEYRLKFRADLVLCLWKTRAFKEARQLSETLIRELEHSTNPEHQEVLLHVRIQYGVLLMEMEEPEAAEAEFRRIIAAAPNVIEPYINMAKLYGFRENFQEVIRWYDKALAIDPESPILHNHLALFLRDAGRPDLALPHHLAALARSPGDQEMRHYLAATHMALGQLQEAYRDWECRWARREGGVKSHLAIPEWTGVPPTGRSLLVYREQGIGDEIIFASCLPDILDRFQRIICVCHSKLRTLFARSFPKIEFRSGGEALVQADVDDMEWQIAIGSLPPIVRPNLAAFPNNPQFLVPDPEKVISFRQRLTSVPGALIVGIGWRSGLLALDRRAHYPYLEFWKPLFDIPNITWVNVQYGDASEELKKAEDQFGVSIINYTDVDHFGDLDTSVALMKACDLVVGTSTSTTMLSAAAGVPTIRMDASVDRYGLGTDYYPWLPSLTRIPRQFGESWSGPIERTAGILRTLLAEHGRHNVPKEVL